MELLRILFLSVGGSCRNCELAVVELLSSGLALSIRQSSPHFGTRNVLRVSKYLLSMLLMVVQEAFYYVNQLKLRLNVQVIRAYDLSEHVHWQRVNKLQGGFKDLLEIPNDQALSRLLQRGNLKLNRLLQEVSDVVHRQHVGNNVTVQLLQKFVAPHSVGL